MRVNGEVAAGFEAVCDAFAAVVAESPGTGSAVAVWRDGAWIVDLWGGYADAARSRPWERESIVMPYSVTKPFAAVCVLVLVDRGLVELDAQMTTYWPTFPSDATVRQVLAHTAGHVVIDTPAPTEALLDWGAMVSLVEAQQPRWTPGEGIGESALLYGHLLGEVVRRVDGRSLGTFLADEVCGPLDLDFRVGLQEPDLSRVVDLTGLDDGFRRQVAQRDGLMGAALANPPGALDPEVVNSDAWRGAEIPAVSGHGTARGVAGLFAAIAEGRLLSPEACRELTSVSVRGHDQVVGVDVAWGLGVGVDDDGWGMGGTGGNVGWWSEQGRYAFGFITGHVADHARAERVENALRDVLGLPRL